VAVIPIIIIGVSLLGEFVGGFGSIIYEGVTDRFSPHRWRSEGPAPMTRGSSMMLVPCCTTFGL